MNTRRQNADPAELDKFSRLSERWWDPEGEFAPLHGLNPLRLGWIERQARGLEGRRVADIGCGGGILSESMAHRGAHVTGIDLAGSAVEAAREHAALSGTTIDYRIMAVEDLAAETPGSFDVVTCMEMLEHVPDPASVVAACAQLARPGAVLVFSTINRTSKSWWYAIVGAEYVLRLLPTGTHDHARFIRPSELAQWSRAAGLHVVDLTGLTYNPLHRRYRLCEDIDVNYMMACRLPCGDDDE